MARPDRSRGPASDGRRRGTPGRPATPARPTQAQADDDSRLRRIVEGLVLFVIASAMVAILLVWGSPAIVRLVETMLGRAANAAAFESYVTFMLYGALAAMGAVGGALCGLNAFAPGRFRPLAVASVGLFSGLFVIAFSSSFIGLAGGLEALGYGQASGALLLLGLLTTLLQAGAEEVFFRGWLQPALARCWGTAPAIVAAAITFALLHFTSGFESPIALANMFLAGLLFGILAAWGKGILGAVAAHFASNAAEIHFLGLFPNPGESAFGTLLDFDLVGPELLGATPAGLNASPPVTLGLALVVVPLVLFLRRSVFSS